MITKRNVTGLAAFTAICLLLAAVLGNHGHGLRQAIADISWFGFLLGVILLVVVGVARLGRWIGRRASASPEG